MMLTYTKIENLELAERYPDWKSLIQRLADADPGFRQICQEYDDTVRVLEHERREALVNAQLVERYETQLHDLEVEAVVCLLRPTPRLR